MIMHYFILLPCALVVLPFATSLTYNENDILQRIQLLEQKQKSYKQLVQKQEEQIEIQATTINSIQRSLSQCQLGLSAIDMKPSSKSNQNEQRLKRDETFSNSTINTSNVGFTAVLTRVNHLKLGNIVPFDSVTYNEGSGYHNGVFVCPENGLYLFLWNIMADIGEDAHVALYINGNPRRWSYAVSIHKMSNAANFYLTRLSVGDRIYLAIYAGDDLISAIQSSFTGVMISSEEK